MTDDSLLVDRMISDAWLIMVTISVVSFILHLLMLPKCTEKLSKAEIAASVVPHLSAFFVFTTYTMYALRTKFDRPVHEFPRYFVWSFYLFSSLDSNNTFLSRDVHKAYSIWDSILQGGGAHRAVDSNGWHRVDSSCGRLADVSVGLGWHVYGLRNRCGSERAPAVGAPHSRVTR